MAPCIVVVCLLLGAPSNTLASCAFSICINIDAKQHYHFRKKIACIYLFCYSETDILFHCSGGSRLTAENEAKGVEPLDSPKIDAVASMAPDDVDSRIQAARDRFLARKSKK